jgi:hypothetical protein
MVNESSNNADDRVVVGYFADGLHASRAISELIDEGFQVAEIGAAFRAGRTGMEVAEGGRLRGVVRENPALSGSVGGPASHDEAVTPAGLAPGSGNAFAAPSKPGPIPGSEIPSTLPHDLPHDLPSTLRHDSEIRTASAESAPASSAVVSDGFAAEEARRERMRQVFLEGPDAAAAKRAAGMKFGTGEGRLFPDYEYSEPSFENSFLGMGLSGREARTLSGELSRGGAVVSIAPGSRASLAEAIVERNHGRVRFETISGSPATSDGNRVEIYGRMRNYYRPEDGLQRKAS